ncbi:MAG: hypothetical protein ABIJ46_00420, partial [bacterium]
MTVYLFNGYGVPEDIEGDANYRTYLTAGLERIRSDAFGANLLAGLFGGLLPVQVRRTLPMVYLAGGATNPLWPDRTEAGEMRQWFRTQAQDVEGALEFRLIDQPLDLRGNLEELRRQLEPDDRVTIFCEYARQDWMRFMAWRMFGQRATVVPIHFDTNETPAVPAQAVARPGNQGPGL